MCASSQDPEVNTKFSMVIIKQRHDASALKRIQKQNLTAICYTYNSDDTSNGGSSQDVLVLCNFSLGPVELIGDLLDDEGLDDGVGITSPYVW